MPRFGCIGTSLRRAIDPQVVWVVDGSLWAQYVEAIVKLEGVLVDPVFEPQPFGSTAQVAHHLASKFSIQAFAQKTHDLLTTQVEHGVQHESWNQPFQGGLMIEKNVAGKLGLRGSPVVG